VRSWSWRIGSWPAAARTWPWRAQGIYWRPVHQILEERQLTVLLVNAAHVKKSPGRKTDVKDGEWIAELLEHGLLRGSFVPPAPLRKLRELTRARCQLIDIHSEEANRVKKVLETANITLGDVATDVLGVSGRAGGDDSRSGATGVMRLQKELVALLRQLVFEMMFNGFTTERVVDSRQDHRIDDLVAGNLRGEKCPVIRQLLIGEFHEPFA
jgi:hypothetical protein